MLPHAKNDVKKISMLKNKQIPVGESVDEDVKETMSDLREIREASGLTLKDVFEKTRINDTHLDAIEGGQFHRLPPPIYTRSFIKAYADFLGTDSRPFLAIYEKYLDSQKRKVGNSDINKQEKIIVPKRDYRKIAWAATAAVIALAVILAVFIHNRSIREDARNQVIRPPQNVTSPLSAIPAVPQPSEGRTNAAPAPVPSSAVAPAAHDTNIPENNPAASSVQESSVPEAAAPAPAQTYHMLIEAKDLTWLRISEDDKEPYQVLMKSGEKLDRNARERFLIDIGNADGVEIKFQGKSLGKLGQPGQVIHLKLP